jgi:hypothetical protein
MACALPGQLSGSIVFTRLEDGQDEEASERDGRQERPEPQREGARGDEADTSNSDGMTIRSRAHKHPLRRCSTGLELFGPRCARGHFMSISWERGWSCDKCKKWSYVTGVFERWQCRMCDTDYCFTCNPKFTVECSGIHSGCQRGNYHNCRDCRD